MINASTAAGDPLRAWVEQLTEADLRLLVRDLLTTMGYEQVAITHGPLEFGRDLIFCETDRRGRARWRAAQVKTMPPSGALATSEGLRSLVLQCEAALDTPCLLQNGQKVKIDEAWLVFPRQMSEQAKHSIAGKFERSQLVSIVDGPELLDLIRRHLPQLLARGSSPLESYLRALNRYCDTPDDYLSARFGTTGSLESSYILPQVRLRLVQPEWLASDTKSSLANDVHSLSRDVPQYLYLLQARLMPYVAHVAVAALIRRAKLFELACVDRHADAGDLARYRAALNEASDALAIDFTQLDPQPGNEFSSGMNSLRLEEEAGDYLRSLDNPVVGSIKVPRNDVARAFKARTGLTDVLPDDVERLARQYDKCYADLAAAYGGSIKGEAVLKLTLDLGAHFFSIRRSSPIDSSRVQRVVEDLASLIDVLDQNLRRQYRAKASALLSSKATQTVCIDAGDLRPISELAQLSCALEAAHDVPMSQYADVRCDAITLLRAVKRVALMGNLGLGKSTTLKRLASTLAVAIESVDPMLVPAFVVLAGVSIDATSDLHSQLLGVAKHFPDSLRSRSGERILWLLDGFDELQSTGASDRIVSWLSAGEPETPGHLVITSRPAALTQYVPNLVKVHLEAFDTAQQREFALRFPWSVAARRERFLEALASAPELAAVAATPLLLTLVAILCDVEADGRLPSRREAIYRRIVMLFLGEWDRLKGVRRSYVIPTIEDRLSVVARVGRVLYAEQRPAFTRSEFVTTCVKHVATPWMTESIADAFVDELIRDCMLIGSTGDQLAFFHLSVQEYLVAVDLSAELGLHRVWAAVWEYFATGRWEEPLVFFAAMKRDVELLIRELSRHADGVPESDQRLQNLLRRWLEAGDFTDVGALNPRGNVARALLLLDIDGDKDRWRRSASLSNYSASDRYRGRAQGDEEGEIQD